MKDLGMVIGEQYGQVVIRFDRPISELPLDADMAKQVAEKLARSAYGIKYNIEAPANKSLMAEQIRAKLLTRISHVIKNLSEKNKAPLYIASHVVDTILSEAL